MGASTAEADRRLRARGISSLPELLVVVPHSGLVVPTEIDAASLSERLDAMLVNVDWHTQWLYDFCDPLDNRQLVFGYCPLLLDANRHPELLDEAVPLQDVRGEALYRPGQEPTEVQRRLLAHKYL